MLIGDVAIGKALFLQLPHLLDVYTSIARVANEFNRKMPFEAGGEQ